MDGGTQDLWTLGPLTTEPWATVAALHSSFLSTPWSLPYLELSSVFPSHLEYSPKFFHIILTAKPSSLASLQPHWPPFSFWKMLISFPS